MRLIQAVVIVVLGFGNVASQVFLRDGYKREAEYRRINEDLTESLKKTTETLKRTTDSVNSCALSLESSNRTMESSNRLLKQDNETFRKVATVLRACAENQKGSRQ